MIHLKKPKKKEKFEYKQDYFVVLLVKSDLPQVHKVAFVDIKRTWLLEAAENKIKQVFIFFSIGNVV